MGNTPEKDLTTPESSFAMSAKLLETSARIVMEEKPLSSRQKSAVERVLEEVQEVQELRAAIKTII